VRAAQPAAISPIISSSILELLELLFFTYYNSPFPFSSILIIQKGSSSRVSSCRDQISKLVMMMQEVGEEEKMQTDDDQTDVGGVGILTNFIRTLASTPHLSVSLTCFELATTTRGYRNVLLFFPFLFTVCKLQCCSAEQQAQLVSFLDVRDLFALRLVSSETKSWADNVILGHRSNKAFTLRLDDEDRTLDGFMDEQKKKKIPFKTLNFTKTRASSFYAHPLLPSFLQSYGPQITRIQSPSGFFIHPQVDEVPPENELAFYQGLPNLIHLSLFITSNLEDENVLPLPTIEKEKLPFLPHLQSFSLQFLDYREHEGPEVLRNIDFLRNCPNLRKLSLPDMLLVEAVKVLTALGDYFAARNNGWRKGGGIPPTLRIFIPNSEATQQSRHDHLEELRQIDEGMVNQLLEGLAASDGRIHIENMPITLLDGAVRLFSKQRQRGKLRSFGKCISSLIGFSDSLYEVELPNMRRLRVNGELIFLGKERDEGDYTETVSWPKLETINLENVHPDSDDIDDIVDSDDDEHAPLTEDLSYMKKLVLESGLRAGVKRLDYDFGLNFLSWDDDEGPTLLRNLPHLTWLTLSVVEEEDGDSFRSLLRRLPTSSPKLQCLVINTRFPLKDEDFLLGMKGDDDDSCAAVPPLLQLSGDYYHYQR
jgi:hypothetical protein